MSPRRRPSRTSALLWTGFLSAALILGVTVVLARNVTGSVRWRIAQSTSDPDAALLATIDRMVEVYTTANPITIVKKTVTGGSSSSAAKSELYLAMTKELREAKTYFAAAPGHPAAAGYGKTLQELRRLSDIYDSYAISRSSTEYGKILDLMKGIWTAFKAAPLNPSFPVKDYALAIEELLGTGRFQPVTVTPQQSTTTTDSYYSMCVNGCSAMSEGQWRTDCYSGCERMRGGSYTYTTTTYSGGYSCSNCDRMSAGADRDRCYAGCGGGSHSSSAGYTGGSWSSYSAYSALTAQEICYKGCDNMSDSSARNSCRDGCSKMGAAGTSSSAYTMPTMTSDAFTMCVSGCKGMTHEQCTNPGEGTKYWCDQKAADACEKACQAYSGTTGSTSEGSSGWYGDAGHKGGMSCIDGCKSMTGVTEEQRKKCIDSCSMMYTAPSGDYAGSCLQGCKTMSGVTDAQRERCAAMCAMTPEQRCQMDTGCASMPTGEKREMCIANCSKSAATYSPSKESAPSTPWMPFPTGTFMDSPEWLKPFDTKMYPPPLPMPPSEKPTPAETAPFEEFADTGNEEFRTMLEDMKKRWETLPPPPTEAELSSPKGEKPELSPGQEPSATMSEKPEQAAAQLKQQVQLTLEEKFLGEQKLQEHQELLSTMIASYQRMSSIHELHVLPKAAQQSVAQGLGAVTDLFSEAAEANLTVGEIGTLSATLTETLATVDTAIEKAAKDVAKKGLPFSLNELIEKKGILSVYQKLQGIIDTIPSAFTIFKNHKIPVPATVLSAQRDVKALLASAKPECEKASAKCIATLERVIDKLDQDIKQPMDRILAAVNKPEVTAKVDKLFEEQ